MNILNLQPINPGGHPAFPAAKESGHLTPASVRFDGVPVPAQSHAHCPRWQAQTLRRDSSYVGVEHEGTRTTASVPVPVPVPAVAPVPAPFKPLTLDFLRSLMDRSCSMSPAVAEYGEDSAPPPPQMVALRVVVASAVELDARQTELIARKMRRLTGFVNLKVDNVVDASLLAGFVVRYGTDDSHVIDLSVKGQLAALQNRVDSIDHQTAHVHGHPHH
ncbi:ATP synthase [Zea mays]|jgi:hypothetical protein|uniref:ATP synthase n=1 Tax=Zea mays TaxID=4577 RepID=B6TZM0_MAIZE|nr:ATP synthase F1, delta subunit family protein [Zea mays]ONM08920.1 ATP synthase [Zea mays]